MGQVINYKQQKNSVTFFARATGAKSVSAGTFTKMDGLTTVVYDYGGNYNVMQTRFIAPVKGVYSFKGAIGIANNSTRLFASIYVNGTEYARASNGSYTSDGNISQVVLEMELNQGSYVELYAWRQSAGTIQHNSTLGYGSLWLCGHLVTPT